MMFHYCITTNSIILFHTKNNLLVHLKEKLIEVWGQNLLALLFT